MLGKMTISICCNLNILTFKEMAAYRLNWSKYVFMRTYLKFQMAKTFF